MDPGFIFAFYDRSMGSIISKQEKKVGAGEQFRIHILIQLYYVYINLNTNQLKKY